MANIKWLVDDINGRYVPFTCTSAIVGGTNDDTLISSKDHSNLINSVRYTGSFKIYSLDEHLSWIVVDISTISGGSFNEGDNIITSSSIPVIDIPDTEFVFTAYTNGTNRYKLYLGTDGRLHLYLTPKSIGTDIAVTPATIAIGKGLLIK